MCGRFALIKGLDKVKAYYGAAGHAVWQESYNIAPSQMIPVVVQNDDGRDIRLMKWGLVPHWAKDEKIGFRMINARSETVDEKPGFRDAFKSHRCIIPASGFYEWRKPDKQPFWFSPENDDLFSLAGLWARWKRADGKILESCTILTTDANDKVAPVHDRMPVILGHNAVGAWLDGATKPQELKELLAPFPAKEMSVVPVSKYVNKPQNTGPACILRNSA
jgi:putative SOS response-associated peptidase YedK